MGLVLLQVNSLAPMQQWKQRGSAEGICLASVYDFFNYRKASCLDRKSRFCSSHGHMVVGPTWVLPLAPPQRWTSCCIEAAQHGASCSCMTLWQLYRGLQFLTSKILLAANMIHCWHKQRLLRHVQYDKSIIYIYIRIINYKYIHMYLYTYYNMYVFAVLLVSRWHSLALTGP